MAARKSGLGRGLDALISPSRPTPAAAAPDAPQAAPLEVEIGRIQPNPLQPRKRFDEQALAELADSIREHGVLQPLVVTQADEPGRDGRPRYTLVAGERRWQASKIAGRTRVPIVVREAAGRELLELALIENLQRADLNPLEEAIAYKQLVDDFGMTLEQVGRRVGKARFTVSNSIRLLQLPAAVQQLVVDGKLAEGHARALLGLGADPDAQRRLAHRTADEGLTVRQIEELVRQTVKATDRSPTRRTRRDSSTDDIEAQFRELLGTKVTLTRSAHGSRLTIHFYDDEQLLSLYDRLSGTS